MKFGELFVPLSLGQELRQLFFYQRIWLKLKGLAHGAALFCERFGFGINQLRESLVSDLGNGLEQVFGAGWTLGTVLFSSRSSGAHVSNFDHFV